MKWIGLTGEIATGKSTVTRILRDLGLPVVDADELAREVVKPGSEGFSELLTHFGPGLVQANGEIDRKALGKLVFGRPEKLRQLEDIIHPRVRDLQRRRRAELAKAGHLIGFYDVPLLFEKNLQKDFDETVVVVCSADRQLARLIARDGWDEAEARKRIGAQLPLNEKAGLADNVIQNDGSLKDLRASVEKLVAKLRASLK